MPTLTRFQFFHPSRALRMRGLVILFLSFLAASTQAASSMCGVPPVGVFKSRFETGEVAPPAYVPNPVLPSEATPLALSVASPADGITVGTAFIQVHGTFAGPPNTGVSVNGRYALQSGLTFLSRQIPLEPGANSITITATTANGATQAITRTVNYSAALAPDVELRSAHAGAYAPFSLKFTPSVRAGVANPTIERIRFDPDGNGSFDFDTTNASTRLSHRFQSPGLYLANIELTLNDGDAMTPPVVVTATHRVMGEDLDVTRASLCNVFEVFRARLTAQQYTSALDVFTDEERAIQESFIQGLGANGGTLAAQIGEIADGTLGQDFAELLLARPIAGEPGRYHSFPLQFARENDGVWRISGL